MWRKLISVTAIIVFLVSMSAQVSGHNGVIVIPNQFEPGGEEHPWGGGEQAITDPVAPLLTTTGFTFSNNIFIDVALNQTWITVKSTFYRIYEPANDKTVIIQATDTKTVDLRTR
ncbi:MAG: hypothetical protein R3F48_01020 [Candidatus Zixiibacteriota bacterium]